MSASMRVYIVVGADRRVRVAKRPQLRADEVAIAVYLRFPDSWGQIVAQYDVAVPDFAPQIEVEGAVAS